ncbi:MAG: DUF2924 domain-containing protein [bacterium]|nr:DUF2924 domain-containing protein [bacterium]
MNTSLVGKIAALRQMTVAELQSEWLRLYGEESRSRNKDFLFRRLAWRLQEVQLGGLSDRAKRRLEELAPNHFVRARTPELTQQANSDPATTPRPLRDPRRPTPGTVITKQYKGRELQVVCREDGVELDGTMYLSATALAKAVTGSKSINGWLFLGVTQRKRS